MMALERERACQAFADTCPLDGAIVNIPQDWSTFQ